MALTKEDGTIVAGANTFCTLEELRAFAAARSATLPTDDAALEGMANKAMDYLASQEARFQGTRVSADQELPFPRYGVNLNGFDVDPTTVPKTVRDAQCALCMALNASVDLLANRDGKGQIILKKVGELTTQYAPTGSSSAAPSSPLVDSFLSKLYSGSSTTLIVERV